MMETIRVLIVEDDFRIAGIHEQYVEKQTGFNVQAKMKTAEETFSYLKSCERKPHVILLDLYIPDVDGMDLFWKLRSDYREIDLIIVSAAAEAETIQTALRGGIADYIVKPVDAARFTQSLQRYKQQRELLMGQEFLTQQDIDQLILPVHQTSAASPAAGDLPKGIDPITLEEITQLLRNDKREGITAVELSKQIGTSRSTARRYLEYLVAVKQIRATLKYGSIGRPERQYKFANE